MIKLLISVNITLSLMFLLMKHPLSLGSILLSQTVTVSLISGNFNQNMWFSYILFLIMIGGMLILFMYMTSVASNEKFKSNTKIFLLTISTPPLLMCMINSITPMMNSESLPFNLTYNHIMSLNKFINPPMSMILVFLMVYLFLALMVSVKITAFKQGSIRQMN